MVGGIDATIESDNEFKKVAGALGLIKGARDLHAKPNLGVELWTGDGKTKLATAVTDVDGYYACTLQVHRQGNDVHRQDAVAEAVHEVDHAQGERLHDLPTST